MPGSIGTRGERQAVARTMESFGYEWTTFDTIEPEDEAFWERYFRDVPLEKLASARTLDAGCGKGRFAFFTASWVDSLVALDGSRAVDAAAKNLAGFPNVAIIRSDVREMPFRPGSFDFVYCLGVLHHLPHPREGFQELCRTLAPGAHLLIYVYSRPSTFGVRKIALAGATILRLGTRRMPHPLLRWLSVPIAALLTIGFVYPGTIGERLKVRFLSSLPLHTYRSRPFRSLWLDTFDRLSAPLEARYVWEDIAPWFAESGLEVSAIREDAGLIVLARNP